MYWELRAITLPLCYSVVSRSLILQDSARMCCGRICCRCYRSGQIADRQTRASLVDTACDTCSALITNTRTHARTTSAHSSSVSCLSGPLTRGRRVVVRARLEVVNKQMSCGVEILVFRLCVGRLGSPRSQREFPTKRFIAY